MIGSKEYNNVLDDIINFYPDMLNKHDDLEKLLFLVYQDFPNEPINDKIIYLLDELLSFKESNVTSSIIDEVEEFLTLPKDEGYYVDIYGKHVSYDGLRTLKKPFTQLPLQLGHYCEMYKCSQSFKYFRSNYCKIKTRRGISRPEPREYQNKLENDLLTYDSIAALWSRQSGKSVTVGNYALWKILFNEHYNAGVAANIAKLAREYLDKVKKVYLMLPIWLQQGIEVWNKSEIELENGSKFMTSATNSDAFRGFTVNLIIVDEIGFIKKSLYDEFADAVFPSQEELEDKQTILTSTANGLNHWYYICKGAENKEDPSKPGKNGFKFNTMKWNEVPGRDKKWYDRQVQKNGIQYVRQNYENVFLGSANTLISASVLVNLEPEEPEMDKYINGLRVYKLPEENHNYIISVDAAKDGLDAFAIQVIDVTKLPFEQVAAANLNVNYLKMPLELYNLALVYNNAYMIIENNEGAGQSIADTLFNVFEYENLYRDRNQNDLNKFKNFYGFRTTTKTKKQMVTLLKIFMENDKLIIKDKKTIEELQNFIEQDNGTYSAEDGFHDDLVMSLCISFAPLLNIKGFENQLAFINKMFDLNKDNEEDTEDEELFTFNYNGLNDNEYLELDDFHKNVLELQQRINEKKYFGTDDYHNELLELQNKINLPN